jgi:hypothetical protein
MEMSGKMAARMNECDPAFMNYLPQTYNDKFGSMVVLQVICGGSATRGGGGGGGGGGEAGGGEAGGGGGGLDLVSTESVEQADMAARAEEGGTDPFAPIS